MPSLFRCKRCLYPNTKPDLRFNAAGICSACQAFEARDQIDWNAKRQEFLDICYTNSGGSHDVVVAVSGGKDSTWQVLKCLELGLKPLAVCATTDHLSRLGRYNLDNIAELCDLIEVTPHKPTRRKIAAFALREVGDISWCEHTLIWSAPAREAVNRGIKLVLYGENPQNEYGAGPRGSEKATDLTQEWANEFGGFLGLRLSDVREMLDLPEQALALYHRPDQGLYRALFMGQFFQWDGYSNAALARAHGWRPYQSLVEGTASIYENLDNLQTGIHDYMRFLKFGYGRACDILSNQIRRGYLSRDEAIELALRHDGDFPLTYLGVPLTEILEPLGIDEDEFDVICEKFTRHGIVTWARQLESYQCSFSTSTDASSPGSSARAGESVPWMTGSESSSAATLTS